MIAIRSSGKISDEEAGDLIRHRVDFNGESNTRRPFERQVIRSRAFFFGKQIFTQDENTGRLRNPGRTYPHQVFYRGNLVQGNVLRSILTVTGAQGKFVVPPLDNTRAARGAAWTSTKLFEHLSYLQNMPAKQRLAALFAAIDGSAIWKVHWDPEMGEKERYYWADGKGNRVLPNADERMRAMLEEEGKYDDLAPGDAAADVFAWTQAWWDWRGRETGFDKCEWASIATVVDLDTIADIYGEEMASHVKPDEALAGSLYYNEVISFMASTYGGLTNYNVPDEKERAQTILCEYWERPTRRNKMRGRNIHYAGGYVLKNRDNVYRATGYPIPLVKQDWITAPGRFLGLGLVEQLISPQHQLNRAIATIAEHQNVYAHPAYLVPKRSEIPLGHLTVQPGSVHSYEPSAGKIEITPVPSLPKEVQQNFEIQRMVMAEISSQQSLDGSKLPGQLRSGPALSAMFHERNKMLIEPAMNHLGAAEMVGRQLLALCHWRYTDDRVVYYLGEDKRFRALKFKRADIRKDLRVLVERGTVLRGPTEAKAEMLEWVQAGILDPVNNPDDKIAAFKVLEFGVVDEIISDRLQEEENQERELEEMMADPDRWGAQRMDAFAPRQPDPRTGQPMPQETTGYPIGEFDDHRAHLRVLVRFIRSEEFRSLDLKSQGVIIYHARMHQQTIQQQEMQALMIQAQLQGGQGQKGQPSRPRPTVAQ